MFIRKYTAQSQEEAIENARTDLGKDASILKIKRIRKGIFFNLFSRYEYEITAATPDNNPIHPPDLGLSEEFRKALSQAAEYLESDQKTADPGLHSGTTGERKQTPQENTRKEPAGTDDIPPASETHQPVPQTSDNNESDLEIIKRQLEELRVHVLYNEPPELPKTVAGFWRSMVDNDMEQIRASELIMRFMNENDNIDFHDKEQVAGGIEALIADRLLTDNPIDSPVSIAIIGPTGVGKTTTLAKLATNKRFFGGRSIGLISTDTYRIAAVDQLRTFARIASLPLEVVYRPEDLPRAFKLFKDKEVILIDTAGRSQNDVDAIEELKTFIDAGKPEHVLLAIAAGTRFPDIEKVIQRFSAIPATSIVVTKLDEISSAGHLLQMNEIVKCPWVYLTTGQNVPEDILEADPYVLARLIMNHSALDYLTASGTMKSNLLRHSVP